MVCGKRIYSESNRHLFFLQLRRSSARVKKVYKYYVKYGSLRKFLVHVDMSSRRRRCRIIFLGFEISLDKLMRLVS